MNPDRPLVKLVVISKGRPDAVLYGKSRICGSPRGVRVIAESDNIRSEMMCPNEDNHR